MPDPAPNEGEYEAGELVEIVADDEISHEERLKLWVAAGARCAFCKRYLLENELTGDAVRIGEMAHIVGRSNKPRSPRGDDPLPGAARNKADNLVLVCPNEHTTIDKTSGVKIWKTDDLRRLKREHEDAIRTLTKMTRDRSTTVLRVAGSIRGSTPSIIKERVHEAVHADLRFPQYRLGAVGSDLEVDLVTNLDETAADYYARTDDVIERRIAQIADQTLAARWVTSPCSRSRGSRCSFNSGTIWTTSGRSTSTPSTAEPARGDGASLQSRTSP